MSAHFVDYGQSREIWEIFSDSKIILFGTAEKQNLVIQDFLLTTLPTYTYTKQQGNLRW